MSDDFTVDEIYLLWDGLRAIAARCGSYENSVAPSHVLQSARRKLNKLLYEANRKALDNGTRKAEEER